MNFSVKKQRRSGNTDADNNQKPVCLCPEKNTAGIRISEGAWISKELKELVISSKIGTNINQATKQLHIGYEPAAAADRLEKNMKLLEQQFEKMKEELKQTYGNHEDIKH